MGQVPSCFTGLHSLACFSGSRQRQVLGAAWRFADGLFSLPLPAGLCCVWCDLWVSVWLVTAMEVVRWTFAGCYQWTLHVKCCVLGRSWTPVRGRGFTLPEQQTAAQQ